VTWEEIRAFLRSRFLLSKDSGEFVGLLWRFPTLGAEVQQKVSVGVVHIYKERWIYVCGELFAESVLAPNVALEIQDKLNFGALIVRGGVYYLRHSLPLDRLTKEDVERALRLVANESARVRMNLAPTTPGGGAVWSTFED
jgi:hypothetical protein